MKTKPVSAVNIQREVIWNNTNISINGQPLFLINYFFPNGLIFWNDILYND